MHLGDWLSRRARLSPSRVALRDMLHGGRPITYREWDRVVNQTARLLLHELGVGRGDRVAVLSYNRVEYLDLWFALGKLGAVLVNLNWRLSAGELGALLGDASPVVLAYGDEFAGLTQELRWGGLRLLALDGPGPGPGSEAAPESGAVPLSTRARQPDGPLPPVELSWDDPWVICYTGGSTGRPKGAVLTHRSITANAVNTVVSWGLTADDVAVLDAPLFHTGGLNVFTAPLVYVGGTSLVCQRFQPEQTFDLIERGGATVYFGVPTMFLSLQEHPRFAAADFSRMKLVISGGAPCPLPVFERFWARGVDFKTGYGLTEAGPNNFWLPAEQVRAKPGSVGYPLFHVDAALLRDDGALCADGEVGELILRGPHVCAGYYGGAAATAADEWLRTGDLAQRDADGCYTIVGRKKEMIISGGENIYPAEIESALHAHPAVLEAVVIGVPDERWGEVGRAVVVLREGAAAAAVDAAALLDHLRERLARYKVPRSVVFVAALPRTGAGKIDRRAIAAQHGQPA